MKIHTRSRGGGQRCRPDRGAQETARPNASEREPMSLDLAINHVGISIGNSRRLTGLRLNWRDEGVVRVNGINSRSGRRARTRVREINGLALGLIAPGAARLNGVIARRARYPRRGPPNGHRPRRFRRDFARHGRGVTAGGLAVVADRGMSGITVGGARGHVSRRDYGVCNHRWIGARRGRIARNRDWRARGSASTQALVVIAFGGLAVVTEGPLSGAAVSGLGVAARGDMTGVAAGGLVTFSSGTHARRSDRWSGGRRRERSERRYGRWTRRRLVR